MFARTQVTVLIALAGISMPAHPQTLTAADSLYRAGRQALSDGSYSQAARLFERIIDRYPRSAHAPDAFYWAAFARYSVRGPRNFEAALGLLNRQADQHPNARTRRDGELLATRIRGELARLGNAEAAESVTVAAAPRRPGTPQACGADEDAEIRLAALNALLQMDSDRALPILREVLLRRDACSVELRRKAVFLVSQKRGPEVEAILLGSARNDPDSEVRSQAIFWLSQVNTESAVSALDSILLGSRDRELQDKAIFALSQQRSARAGDILRRYIERADAPDELKAQAIFWLGQRRSPENVAYLREIYPRLTSHELKDKVIFAFAQMRGEESGRWLMEIVNNPNESTELRKSALFWMGQKNDFPVANLVRLYDTINDRDLQEQLIFVYSQRRGSEAVDQLMAIAENDRDKELREKAIFWLGQSKDPRVVDFLLRLINR